jgi:hypothetical protein
VSLANQSDVADLKAQLASVLSALDQLRHLVEGGFVHLNEVISQIDLATNNLATRVRAIQDRLASGMSSEDVAAAQTELAAIAARLDGIAADPEQPVPTDS